jgi:hypothetical protein
MKTLCYVAYLIIFGSCIFTQTKPPEAITVQTPTSAITTTTPDSSFLQIKQVKDSSYNISLLGKSFTANSPALLDEFISTNKDKIDIEKILVYQTLNTNDSTMIKLADIFRKHDILRFRIISN